MLSSCRTDVDYICSQRYLPALPVRSIAFGETTCGMSWGDICMTSMLILSILDHVVAERYRAVWWSTGGRITQLKTCFGYVVRIYQPWLSLTQRQLHLGVVISLIRVGVLWYGLCVDTGELLSKLFPYTKCCPLPSPDGCDLCQA